MQFKQKMSNLPNSIHFNELEQQIKLAERSKKDLIEFLNISKGKMLTLIKTVFSFINDKSLLRKESPLAFNKYTIESKLVQTMSKVYDFYISNFPENGRETLHELIKERYLKFIKFYEENENYFFNSSELMLKFYLIQGMILLWLIEIKYDSEYYDEIIRVINGLIQLNNSNNNVENNYLNDFLNTILKFPYIKQNKEIIIHALEVNECSENILTMFNEKINNLIKKRNSKSKPDINLFETEKENNNLENINLGKKSISSVKEESYFSLMKENKKEKEKIPTSSSISNKRKSVSGINSNKSVLSSINSSGFYTPEFKHAKRDSIRHYRRFTINNINNPKTSIQTKNNTLSRSLSTGMSNLLNKCEAGINNNKNNNANINNNNNSQIQGITNGPSTKSKLRLVVEGHFYPEDNTSNNNINAVTEEKESTNNNNLNNNNNSEELMLDNNNNITTDENNLINTEICPCENEEEEIENNIVSVDELPINPNLSMISNSNSKNIGVEPENIIQETKEEEENDENDIAIDKNDNNKIGSNNTYIKMLTENEIKNFFSQQFSDKKNNEIKKENKLSISSNLFKNENDNKKNKEDKNKNKNKKRNTSKNKSINTLAGNKSQKNINSKKTNKAKSKSRSKSKENNNSISTMNKRKNYSQNIFGMIKNNKSHKNNKKENVLKNKNENVILEPCTKGKELMNEIINNYGSKKNEEKERLPTDSHAKKNLLSLYNQMKAKK